MGDATRSQLQHGKMTCRSMERVCVFCCLLMISSIRLDGNAKPTIQLPPRTTKCDCSLGIPMCAGDTQATELKGDASFGSKVCISEESLNRVTFVITLKMAV